MLEVKGGGGRTNGVHGGSGINVRDIFSPNVGSGPVPYGHSRSSGCQSRSSRQTITLVPPVAAGGASAAVAELHLPMIYVRL